MSALYPDAEGAVRMAFAEPRDGVKSLWGLGGSRGYGTMTANEWIAQHGMVKALVMDVCPDRAIMAFTVLWDYRPDKIKVAMAWHADAFSRPGRSPPRAWGVSIVNRWARRRIVRARSDAQWAQALNIDPRTAGAWRRELVAALEAARREGMTLMEHELRVRDLIPNE